MIFEWLDISKEALKNYLINEGYTQEEVNKKDKKSLLIIAENHIHKKYCQNGNKF